LGRTREPIHKKFSLNVQAPSISGRNQVVPTEERRNSTLLYTTLECNQNSAEDVFDERAIDAFSAVLRRSNLMEEVGRTKPRTVSELMEVANRFADGEDAYNNKGDTHQKSTKQAGKGKDTVMEIAMQDETR
jgi:pantothenate synthetase